ncbi:hypothetical protein [Wolbachia endosymbiont of Pentidionis agamae]|uniref:hypothetical protein n=1 Tax=Wolbachia endosymbiont of Pentidionis agamae TaxID=3110435 RepID=UPI002FCF3F4E
MNKIKKILNDEKIDIFYHLISLIYQSEKSREQKEEEIIFRQEALIQEEQESKQEMLLQKQESKLNSGASKKKKKKKSGSAKKSDREVSKQVFSAKVTQSITFTEKSELPQQESTSGVIENVNHGIEDNKEKHTPQNLLHVEQINEAKNQLYEHAQQEDRRAIMNSHSPTIDRGNVAPTNSWDSENIEELHNHHATIGNSHITSTNSCNIIPSNAVIQIMPVPVVVGITHVVHVVHTVIHHVVSSNATEDSNRQQHQDWCVLHNVTVENLAKQTLRSGEQRCSCYYEK